MTYLPGYGYGTPCKIGAVMSKTTEVLAKNLKESDAKKVSKIGSVR